MAVYLVQHGKSLSKEVDPEKGLSDEGKAQVDRIAQVAAGYEVPVSRIVHSGKKRARQTAECFADFLKPQEGIAQVAGVKPLDDVTAFAQDVKRMDNCMIVGHLPFMERLTAYLITGDPEKSVIKFQNGGMVCLDQAPDQGGWIIKWALMPDIG